MRIWIVNNYAIPPQYGGLVRHFYFSKYLRAHGHEVRIFTGSQIHNTSYNFVDPGHLIKEMVVDGVPYSYVRTISYTKNNWRRVLNMLQFSYRCRQAMEMLDREGEHPDVIYASSPLPMAAKSALTFARHHKVPFVFEVRDLWPESIVEYGHLEHQLWSKPMISALYHLEHALYRGADANIFTMEGGADYLREHRWTDVPLDRVYSINNGVDLQDFNANLQHFTYTDPDLDDEATFKIVYVGSIRMIYHLDQMLDVALRIRNRLPQVRFFFYGDGPERARLEKRVKEEAISNVFFKGKVNKEMIPSILKRADVGLAHNNRMPLARFGTSNNKLFDYLAGGVPVLSTVKSNYSLIEREKIGVETEEQTVESISEAIRYLVELPEEERRAMGQRAAELAKEYDYRRLTEKLEAILKRVCEGR